MALDLASSLSRKLAYVPGPILGPVEPPGSSDSHTWLIGSHMWTDKQHRSAGFELQIILDLSLSFIPTLIGLRGFDLVSSLVWWETLANSGGFTTLSGAALRAGSERLESHFWWLHSPFPSHSYAQTVLLRIHKRSPSPGRRIADGP